MAYLFEINGKAVFPNAETILVYPFKDIWERDLTEGKVNAIQEFAYIEFMTSMLKSNPYREYPEDKKEDIIKKDVITQMDWKPDELIQAGMDYIVEKQKEGSLTYTYWLANKIAIEKMIHFFNNFDMDERNPRTFMPVYKPKDITSSVSDAEKTLTTIAALKAKVEEELYESNKTRSGKIISVFAHPDSLK